MTFWQIAQAFGSLLGGLSFVALVVGTFFNEKIKDWFLSKSEERQHKLAVIRERDRSNTDLRSKIILELFQRKITTHKEIRSKAFDVILAVSLATVMREDKESTQAQIEFHNGKAVDALQSFQGVVGGSSADLSRDAEGLCIEFGTRTMLAIYPHLDESGSKSKDYGQMLKAINKQFNEELRTLYREGFESLIDPK